MFIFNKNKLWKSLKTMFHFKSSEGALLVLLFQKNIFCAIKRALLLVKFQLLYEVIFIILGATEAIRILLLFSNFIKNTEQLFAILKLKQD